MSLKQWLSGLILAVVACNSVAVAQKAPAAGAQATPEADKKDPFEVPPGTDKQTLTLFLLRMARTPPANNSPDGQKEHLAKIDRALEEILSREIDEELFSDAAKLRFQVLSALVERDVEAASGAQTKLMEQLQKDQRPSIQRLSQQLRMATRIDRLTELSAEEKKQLVNDLANLLKNVDQQDEESLKFALQASMQTAESLEQLGDNEEAALAYTSFSKELTTLDKEKFEELTKQLDARGRRLSLPGNEIEITGTTTAGKKFDIKDYKGKVVLIDFWATWCGPCRQELPHVKEMYEAYHSKGFEVVGISLDEDKEKLDAFLENEGIAWVTLFEGEEEKQGWENPNATRYGISGIPTVILVNQEGKVVHLNARGPLLTEALAKLLGPLEKPAGKADEKKTDSQ